MKIVEEKHENPSKTPLNTNTSRNARRSERHHGVRRAEDVVRASRGPGRHADGHRLVAEARGIPDPDLAPRAMGFSTLFGVFHWLFQICSRVFDGFWVEIHGFQ